MPIYDSAKPNNGVWVSRNINTIYQAEEDGFFVGTVRGSGSSVQGERYQVYSDSSATPTTLRNEIELTGHTNEHAVSGKASAFSIPVRKGDYYRVTEVTFSGSISQTNTFWWIPRSAT